MKSIIIGAISMYITYTASAQNNINLKETIISSSKKEQEKSDVANQVTIINQESINKNLITSTPELLEKKGDLFIQRSQLGGGSPVIRGFEASRILIVVDGIRMNNAIYRAGHLQNVMTLDHSLLERVEVINGPGSVVYGSDALGGVISLQTRKPKLSTRDSGEIELSGGVNLQYASASDNRRANFHINIGGKKIASMTSLSMSEFGNLRIGRNNSATNPSWGTNPSYSEFVNGKDTSIENTSPWVLHNTAFRQYDALQKFLFKVKDGIELIANFQVSTSTNVPRTDRLNFQNSNGKLTNAEWSYGPQLRALGSLQLNLNENRKLYSKMSITAAFQKIHEQRITRSYGNAIRSNRFENVSVASLNIDATKKTSGKHTIGYGFEFNYNEVYSNIYRTNVVTGATDTKGSTRYPENGSFVRSTSIYLKDDIRLNDMWTLTLGARANNYSLTSFFSQPTNSIAFTQFDNTSINFAGNAAINFNPCEKYRFYTMISTGYRAPNLDDFAKFSPDVALKRVTIPNTNLQAENNYNWEMGFYYSPSSKWELEATPYVMYINNYMQISPIQVNGSDSILADGQMMKAFGLTNRVAALNAGINAKLNYKIHQNFTAYTSYTYTFGQNITDGKRLDHIAPMFGSVGLDYVKDKFLFNTNIKYNGAKTLEFYGPTGSEDNIEYALLTGTPAWWTMNLSGNYNITRVSNLLFGIDNLFDIHYRPFASTISAPGISIMAGFRATF
jgi:hemoglobin/transferrin/lactoferrin receptor protein